ncbi:trypsin-like peptidase domain-containing protein [Gordonia sp. CPCC 206044]|uniref:trypsin-like peptidase domain-containing protein n=1 Tax=Gordonia sp. CPCC 206044 TaxID=3140793 RepID=UPI003AF3EEBD
MQPTRLGARQRAAHDGRTQCAARVFVTLTVAGVTAASTMLWASPAAAAPDSANAATRAAAVIKPSVVYLETWLPDHTHYRCSGFGVSPDGYIATAGHCVDPDHLSGAEQLAASGNQILDQIAQTGMRVAVLLPGPSGEKPTLVASRVVDARPQNQGDVALVKVPRTNLPSAQLAAGPPEIAQPVQSFGYPKESDAPVDYTNLEATARSGTVNAIKTIGPASFIEVSADLAQGMSGGPTINDDGKVLGVNSFRPQAIDDGTGGSLNPNASYIAAASELREMLRNNGVTPELSPADDAYRAALGQYYDGDYGEAAKNFDLADQLTPGYPNAEELKTDAIRNREASGDHDSQTSGLVSALLIGGGIVVVLALLGAGGYYLYSRRGNRGGGDMPGGAVPAGAAPAPQPAHSGAPAAAGPTEATRPVPGAPAGDAIRCQNCGFEIPPGQAFCGRCGKQQD